MSNFDTAISAVSSAKLIVDCVGSNQICPELGFTIRMLMDEAYRAIMEMQTESTEPDPAWIVEKPVPVGSEAAKQICQKVRQENIAKKKGRPRKNDD